MERTPKLELKELPAHLRYAFFSKENTSPVILSIELSKKRVEAALLILTKRKAPLGWKMSYLHGISSALCMHKIYMKEGVKSNA